MLWPIHGQLLYMSHVCLRIMCTLIAGCRIQLHPGGQAYISLIFCFLQLAVLERGVEISHHDDSLMSESFITFTFIFYLFSHLLTCICFKLWLSSWFTLWLHNEYTPSDDFYNYISWTKNFQMFKLDLEKAEEPEIKLQTSIGSCRKQENSRKTSTSASLTTLKPLTVWITTDCGKSRLPYLPPKKSVCRSRSDRTGHGTWTGSKLGKEYIKAVYCHLAYFTYMQSTSCEMPGWMKHKLESRLPGEMSITSDMQMTPPLWQKATRN